MIEHHPIVASVTEGHTFDERIIRTNGRSDIHIPLFSDYTLEKHQFWYG